MDWKLTDNGHSIVFQIANDDHDYDSIGMSGGLLGNTYNFHSFHFHWGDRKMGGGSEHTLNGNHHFAEVHFVHYG